jgi:Na+/H+ antiporter NhaD/arsenite permease-like protein
MRWGRSTASGPLRTLPVFVAMMFGATLGANATLIGAPAKIAGTGNCAAHCSLVNFASLLCHGQPISACQMAMSCVYALVLL